jgi:hypothetical protein
MTSFIILGEKKIEVVDRQVFFEAGEKLLVEQDGVKTQHAITSVTKVLRINSDMCDVVQEVYLT